MILVLREAQISPKITGPNNGEVDNKAENNLTNITQVIFIVNKVKTIITYRARYLFTHCRFFIT